MATSFLRGLLRRDAHVPIEVAAFFIKHCTSPQSTIRTTAQKYTSFLYHVVCKPLTYPYRAITKLTAHVKLRTYSRSFEDLWLDEWTNPLARRIKVSDPSSFLSGLAQPIQKTER